MNEKFIRAYRKMDVDAVKDHLLIHGDLFAQCAHCQAMDLKLELSACPKCGAEFKFIAFRNVKNHLPKLQKITAQRPSIQIIDYDDFKRETAAQKAKDFLK